MSNKIIQIAIPADEDGYVSFNCPYCKQRFKLRSDEFKKNNVINLFCPICGLIHELNHFYSKEFIEKALGIAEQEAMELIHDMLKGFERKNSRNKFLKFKAGPKPKVNIKEIYDNIDELVEVKVKCCKNHLKVTELDKMIGVYCSYCGVKNRNE